MFVQEIEGVGHADATSFGIGIGVLIFEDNEPLADCENSEDRSCEPSDCHDGFLTFPAAAWFECQGGWLVLLR